MRIRPVSTAHRLLAAVTMSILLTLPTPATASDDPSPTSGATVHDAAGAPAGHAVVVRAPRRHRVSVRITDVRPGDVYTVWLLTRPGGCRGSCDAADAFGPRGVPRTDPASDVDVTRIGAHVAMTGDLHVVGSVDVPSGGSARVLVRSEGRFDPTDLTPQLAGTAGTCAACTAGWSADVRIP